MHEPRRPAADATVAFLEHYPEPGGTVQRIALDRAPFRLGRSPGVELVIPSRQVSKEHAEILQLAGQWRVRDLNSTNGTFVNGQRVKDALLTNGDIVHVAHKEFRFGCAGAGQDHTAVDFCTEQVESRLPPSLIRAHAYLQDMLANSLCRSFFQPIVSLENWQPVGHEALARGGHPQLSANPTELFRLAEQCGLAAELSRLFRTGAVAEALGLAECGFLFLNLHPAEMHDARLLESFRDLANRVEPGRRVVIEVSESVVTDAPSLRRLREELNALGMGLAYDDIGAGQSRLTELIEVPPDFVKLDMGLIRDIHLDRARQQLVRALSEVINNLGVRLIAEGVETREEAETCLGLGCHYGQGYLFGRPQPSPLGRCSEVSVLWTEYVTTQADAERDR